MYRYRVETREYTPISPDIGHDVEGFGINPHRTREMWQEAIQHVVGCWTNERYAFEGKHWSMPERRVGSVASVAARALEGGGNDST